jgi:WD40 repeat protein
MRILAGHTQFVQGVAFSPRGNLLASASADHTIKLWDLTTGQELRTLTGHTEWVTSVCFGREGDWLVSGSHDGRVCLWNVNGRASRRGPGGEHGTVSSVDVSADGKQVAWGSYNGSIGVWSPGRRTRPGALPGGDLLFCVRFSPNAATLASGGQCDTVTLWDVAGVKAANVIEHADRRGCWSIAWFPDGRTVALALSNGVQVWDVRGSQLRTRLDDHKDVVSAVAVSPYGRRLLSSSWDGTVRLYETNPSGAVLGERACYNWGLGKLHEVTFSPDGMTAAACGNDGGRLVVWDVE